MKSAKTNYYDIAELVQHNFRDKIYFHIANSTHYKVKLKFLEIVPNYLIHSLGEYHNNAMYQRGVTWAIYTKFKSYKF
jgi:hypothetical protein